MVVIAGCGKPGAGAAPPSSPSAPSPSTADEEPTPTTPAAAIAAVRTWLAHPMEMGREPATASVVWSDRRVWPGFDDPVEVFLVGYDMGDGSRGIAVTGPITWSFFQIDFDRLSHEDLAKLYAGWFLEFVVLQDAKTQELAATEAEITAALGARGLAAITVLDRVRIGDDTYFAARAEKDGAATFVAGTADDLRYYDASLPQMMLPPLFWFLGTAFYEE